jgi:outer membrane protein assembly factor BamB
VKALAIAATCLALAACGGAAPVFGLTADDNNPARLAGALAARGAPRPGPRNATGAPMVFAVTSGAPRRLVAYDLAAGAVRWSVAADVTSRVAVAGDLVVGREGGALVARAVTTGAVRWQRPLGDTLVGVDADSERVYAIVQDGRAWTITALAAGSGAPVWSATAPGALGAPAAPGGIVLVPFLSQWLTILDARTGALVTRVRGTDEQISFVRDLGGDSFFGAADGVVRLDARAASGRRASSSYATVPVPAPLARATYAADGFDGVQAAYSAHERTRILWWPADGAGLTFAGGAAVHWFRFVFGLAADGGLRWAYVHPRVELVSSEHVGAVLALASAGGEIIALDPASGALRARVALGVGAIAGATFDAAGWAPAGEVAPAPVLAASLVAIARDRDQRWSAIQTMAIARLASEPGAAVTAELLAMAQDERVPAPLRDAAATALAERTDPAGLPALTAALAVPDDMIDGTAPVAVAVAARGVAALRGTAIDPGARQAAIAALLLQLRSPSITTRDLAAVVAALVAIGDGAERAPLTRFLLVHRADPEVAGDSSLVAAVVAGLAAGGAAEREVVRFVADDPRSARSVASHARAALAAR